MPNGVTASTPSNLVVGAGIALVDHAVVGATLADNIFRIVRTYFTPALNGVKGALLGTDYIVSSEGQLEASIPEISASIYAKLWPGSQSNTVSGDTVISEDDTRRIPTTDYHDWELRVERLDGGHFGFHADHGLNLGNIESTLGNAAAAAPRAVINSRWNAADTTISPHRIVINTTAGS